MTAPGQPVLDRSVLDRSVLDRSMEGLRSFLAQELIRSRVRSEALTDALDDDDLRRQHSALMSPLIWDFAHIGNQEELWLVRDVGGGDPVRTDIDELYDAFKHARSDRPTLPLLTPIEARGYARTVRDKAFDVLAAAPLEGRRLVADGFAFAMIVQHEQQHDETMLATHQLRAGPPALRAESPRPIRDTDLPGEVLIPAGSFTMGTDLEPWALDNERPAHGVHVPAFWIDTVPVSNGDFTAFIEAGGYVDMRWWGAEGWAHRVAAGLVAPQFWRLEGTEWWRRRFGVDEPVPPGEPVQHVCYFEAEAYARWAGKRLPSEPEWEKAARWNPATNRSLRYPWGDDDPTCERANLGGLHLQPAPVGSYPSGASPLGVRQLIGDVWEWTSSNFAGYPGFVAFPYREYSQVFFGGDYKVLRGGSWAADRAAVRGTFRNWDLPIRRQIFSGFRCARDAAEADAS
jgi:gamma-glutamyl hercynylcysteine S-oxide synthase